MSLLCLPIELIYLIAEESNLTPVDLKNLRQTNQHLRNIITPILIRGQKNKALVFAAKRGYLSLAQESIAVGASVEAVDWRYSCPAIHWAAMGGHSSVVKLLLDNGARVARRASGGWTALHWAAATGERFVEGLVNARFNFRSRGHDRKRRTIRTPFMSNEDAINIVLPAAEPAGLLQKDTGHDAVVALLLGCGANVDAKTRDKKTALCLAVQFQHRATVELLLKRGADIRLGSLTWLPALTAETAVDSIFRVLVESQGPTRKSRIPCHELDATFLRAATSGNEPALRLLLDGGASVTAYEANGKNALHLAVGHSHHTVILALLDAGLEINSIDLAGRTALHLASSPDTMQLLLSHGADTGARDQFGQTPLHRAVISSSLSAVKQLLKYVAFIGEQDDNGLTPFHWAAMARRADVVQLLVSEGANVKIRGRDGRTLLHDIIYHSDVTMVGLYNEPTVWSKNFLDDTGSYRNHKICGLGADDRNRVDWEAMVELLVALGVDIFATDGKGNTAQTAAKRAGWSSMVAIMARVGLRG